MPEIAVQKQLPYVSRNYSFSHTKEENDYEQKAEITPVWMKRGKYKMPFDKYYTNEDVAQHCYKSLLQVAKKYGINTDQYTFIEPSAGEGVFYDLLPEGNRIGLDIKPEGKGIVKMDFFDWKPQSNKKYISIGNPPFGLRGWLALAFINKAAEFSDLVGFILPMYFDSNGKGSAKTRVKGMYLLHSEELRPDIFHNGVPVNINTVWQVWGKIKPKAVKQKTLKSDIEIFTVCTNPSRRCGFDKMDKYALFIASTFYTQVQICKEFKDVKYGSGYGLIIHKNKKEIEKYLQTVDWLKYNMRATNHCKHIGKTHILQALIDGGF